MYTVDQTDTICSERERQRKRVLNLIAHHKRRGNTARVQSLQIELSNMFIGGVLPDIDYNLIAHCGAWHIIDSIPCTVPCCNTVVLVVVEGDNVPS